MKASNLKIPIFAYFSWGLAFFSIFVLTIDLFIRAPEPLNPFSKDNALNLGEKENQKQLTESQTHTNDDIKINENCCIATIFDHSSIKQTIALGYSLFKAYGKNETSSSHNQIMPKTFALFKVEQNENLNISKAEMSALKEYFEIINISNEQLESTNEMTELLFWTTPELKECFPVVALTHNGLFNRNPNRICNSSPFSAVSKTGDIVFFDTSLMVLDPSHHPGQLDEKYKKNPKNKQFKKYINYQITDWKPLATDLSVEDYNNEFLDFWTQFGTPTFIHFEDKTFYNAVNGINKTSGSSELFKIIVKLINEVKLAHPNIFQS